MGLVPALWYNVAGASMRSNNILDIVDKYRHSINNGSGMILMLNLTHLSNC